MKKFVKAITTITATLACVFMAICLTACVPLNAEKAYDKMKNAGYSPYINHYSAEMFANEIMFIYNVDGLSAGAKRVQVYNDNNEYFNIFYFENTADANKFYKLFVIREMANYNWEIVNKQGKIVYFGSKTIYDDIFIK